MDGSAAYTNPSSGKIDQQRKILEDLERQKKLLKAGTTPAIGMLPMAPASAVVTTPVAGEGHITSGQRSALDSANKTSFGFFIPQDSSFGNIILPVIPRLVPKNPPK